MDNPSINIKIKNCQKHNQLIQYYDENGGNPQCEGCLIEKDNLITFEQIQKKYQQIIINDNNENDLQLQQLHNLKDGILRYKEGIISVLNKSIQQIVDQIMSIQSQKQSIQQLDYIMNKYPAIDKLTIHLNTNQKSNREMRYSIIINLLQDIKLKVKNIDFLHSNRKQQNIIQTQVPKRIQIQEIIPNKQKSIQKIVFELIHQVSSKELIYDLVIDQSNNALITAMSDGIIKTYNFQNSKVGDQIQSLQAHTKYVGCLHRMKNTNSFVSGSGDSSIIIWCLDKDKQWKVQQTLKSHQYSVDCIIMNQKEDLLISGSYDTLKFWRKQNDSWNLLQTINAGGIEHALSLNENEDKLIACTSYRSQIQVMNIKSNQEWEIIQTIEVNEYGYRLCFTIQDQFVFQPETSEYLEIYDYNRINQQFYQKTKVQVQGVKICDNLFPCQYIKKLNILTVKHGQFVNIFKVNQNGEYKLIQSIEYQKYILQGKMTDDGEYLITWDRGSGEIQVRQLKFKEELS